MELFLTYCDIELKIILASCSKHLRNIANRTLFIPNQEQMKFFSYFAEGRNIILTACAGSGKSKCIKIISKKYSDIILTATTGFAANLISGITIDYLITYLENVDEIKLSFNKIIIDEASMLGERKMLRLDLVLRDRFICNMPFGGKQIVLVGDFLQLPPVLDSPLIFSSYLLEMSFSVVLMRNVYRQSDSEFVEILNNVRIGFLNKKTEDFLRSLTSNIFPEGIEPVHIVATNKEAKQINSRELEELEGECVLYRREGYEDCIMTRLPKNLRLKIGAKVMLLYNLDISKGLVNGLRGVVKELYEDGPIVTFSNGVTMHIKAYTDKHKKILRIPPSDDPIDKILKKASASTFVGFDIDYINIKQIPLRLSWAITVHKSQGTTLDYIHIDCSKIGFYGQFYTALSRAKSHKNVILTKFTRKCILVNNDIVRQLIYLVKYNKLAISNPRIQFYESRIIKYIHEKNLDIYIT